MTLLDRGRKADLEQLKREYNAAKTPKEKAKIDYLAHSIRYEDKKIRSMRESLIKAHRNGEVDNIKDIHDFIKKKDRYKNDYQRYLEKKQW